MIFLGYTSGMKGFKFMRKPNNVIFHGVTAMFDEHMFPSCPDHISPGSTHIRDNYPGTEFNIPPEDGDTDGGDAFFLNVLPAGGGPHYNGPPGGPSGPQGPQGSSGFPPVPPQHPHQPPTPEPEPLVTPLDQGINPPDLDQRNLYSKSRKGKGRAQDPGPNCPETPSQHPCAPMHPDFLPNSPGPIWNSRLSHPLGSQPEPSWTLNSPISGDMYKEWRRNRDRRRDS